MYHQLTREQRYAIYLGLQEGKSREAIARQIKLHPSTVGREIKRNSTRLGRYSWRIAQETADLRKERLPGNRGIDRNVLEEALCLLNPNRSLETELALFLMTAIRKMWLYIVGS